MESVSSFLHLAFITFITLFPAVNPVGTSFIVDPLLSDLNKKQRLLAARKISLYSLTICVVSVIVGSWIMKLFGLSLPIVQIAGGIIIFNMGWNLLISKKETNKGPETFAQPEDKYKEAENILFYPISFPMLSGAGTISVLLTLSASSANKNWQQYLFNTGSLIVGIMMMVALIYICLINTLFLFNRIGQRGQQVVNRISAFLVMCVGLQIIWEGIQHLLKTK